MNLEARLTQKFVDAVLSKIVDLSKYDNNPKLANLHEKKAKIIMVISGGIFFILNLFENHTLNQIGWLILFLFALSYIAFKRVLFQKGLLDMSEHEKLQYEKQLKYSNLFTMLLFLPILIVVAAILSALHKSGVL
ncbi:MAG: hypothetical protein K2Y14_07255 [Burkholderiales bacterium]|nr:hypothetical protein [Burkholderiales bacterium]